MGIKLLTPITEVDKYLEEKISSIEKVIMRNLSFIGESCIIAARSTSSYNDITGNLRSSIGYVIVKNGQIVNQVIYEDSKGTDKKTGVNQAANFVKQLAKQFSQGIALVIVAGMNYAAYVSAKGLDVLDSAELLAQKLIPQIMTQLGFTKR